MGDNEAETTLVRTQTRVENELAHQALENQDDETEVVPFRFIDVHWTDLGFKPERKEVDEVTYQMRAMLDLRSQYCFNRQNLPQDDHELVDLVHQLNADPYTIPSHVAQNAAKLPTDARAEWSNGVVRVTSTDGSTVVEGNTPSYVQFSKDLRALWNFVKDAKTKAVCVERLTMLQKNFEWHMMLNGATEKGDSKHDEQDFFSVMKVDNHIHAASAMTEVQARNMLRKFAREDWDEQVLQDGTTMGQMFERKGISQDQTKFITADRLGHAADTSMFHRFDNFNDSYNPMGDGSFREVFMKSSNHVDGRYFAASMKEMVYPNLVAQAIHGSNVAIEPRLSIYGNSPNEWTLLAKWWLRNKMAQTETVKWVVQLPRLYWLWGVKKLCANFQEYLQNVFQPMIDATLRPEEHPELALFLCHLGFIDSVDDESKSAEDPLLYQESGELVYPDKYESTTNPPYSYYMYYCAANLSALNCLREKLHLNTIPYKPHCGEAGNVHHLASCYMLAESINHGITLQHTPTLQYLYYLNQIGLALCPLSNNALFLKLHKSPVGRFFQLGLKVALGTDDPLQFHITQEPLVEEYSVARNLWGLTGTDLTEIARNSVDISAFDPVFKAKWIGDNHNLIGVAGNDISKTNLTAVRAKYRTDAWTRELSWMLRHAKRAADKLTQEGKQALEVQAGMLQVNDVLWDLQELGVIADPVTVHETAELVDKQKLQHEVSSLKRQLTKLPGAASSAAPTKPAPVQRPTLVSDSVCDSAAITYGLVGALMGGAAAVSVMLAWKRLVGSR